MDIINCKRFRFSVYKEYKVTGEIPVNEFRFVTYNTCDHGGKQKCFSLKMFLTTFYFKYRGLNNE